MKKYYLISLAGIIALTASCNENIQKDASITTNISSNIELSTQDICGHEENNVIVLKPLDTLILTTKIQSVYPLSQMKLNIHDAGDCHDHERPAVEWSYSKIFDLEGTDVTRHDTIVIPGDVELHNHHLDITILDETGFQGEEVEYNLLIVE